MRNLQEQVKKTFCYQKLFWHFTVRRNCSSDLKIFANSLSNHLNFKSFSRSLEQFFLTVGQNNFGNKIPFLHTTTAYTVFNSKSEKDIVSFFFAYQVTYLIKVEKFQNGPSCSYVPYFLNQLLVGTFFAGSSYNLCSFSLLRLLYISTSTVQRLEICRRCTVEVER